MKRDQGTGEGTDAESVLGPARKCIATGRISPLSEMLRFVPGPDNTVVPDILGKLPGRGIWVSADKAALRLAIDKSLFSRAAKQSLRAPDTLVEQVEALLTRRVIDLIALSRKSGRAVAGYEKVKDWLTKGEASVLLQSSDGSQRGKSKLSTPYRGSYIGWLTSDELGLAFGRQTVIHGALAAGGLTHRVVEEAQRLRNLRVQDNGRARGRKGK